MNEYARIKKAHAKLQEAIKLMEPLVGLESARFDLICCASELQSEMLALEDLMAGDALNFA